MEQAVKSWVDRAEYDLETARAMLASGRYLYVIFCCQQCIEKALKAIIVQRTGELPPRLHNLPALAERADVTLDGATENLFKDLVNYYIKSRYPEGMASVSAGVTKEIAGDVFNKTEESAAWLYSMLK